MFFKGETKGALKETSCFWFCSGEGLVVEPIFLPLRGLGGSAHAGKKNIYICGVPSKEPCWNLLGIQKIVAIYSGNSKEVALGLVALGLDFLVPEMTSKPSG